MRKKWEEISAWLVPSAIYIGMIYFAIKSADAASDKEFTAAIYWLLVAAVLWAMLRHWGSSKEKADGQSPV